MAAQTVDVLSDMKAIHQAYQDKHYAIAEQLLRDYLSVSPKDAEALYLLGNVLVLQNRKTEAAEPYRRAVTYGGGLGAGQYAKAALASLMSAECARPSQMPGSGANVRSEATPRLDKVRSINAADQERKQFLEKELADQVGWRRKEMNRKITEAQIECEDAIKSLPAIPCAAARSEIVQAVRNDEINSIKKRAEERIASFKADFEIKESELTELYQQRIAAIDADAGLHAGQLKEPEKVSSGGSAVRGNAAWGGSASARGTQVSTGTGGGARTGAPGVAPVALPNQTQSGARTSGNYVRNFVNYGQGTEAPAVPSQPAATAVAGKLSVGAAKHKAGAVKPNTGAAKLSTDAAKPPTSAGEVMPKKVSK